MNRYRATLQNYLNKKQAGHSDALLLHYFKIIRYQCKYMERPLDTLLEYINELEYRGIKYRL